MSLYKCSRTAGRSVASVLPAFPRFSKVTQCFLFVAKLVNSITGIIQVHNNIDLIIEYALVVVIQEPVQMHTHMHIYMYTLVHVHACTYNIMYTMYCG